MVSEKIVPGLKAQKETFVCEHNIAGHITKFSTPAMIGLMEGASQVAVNPLLEPGQITVGFIVNVRHLAPADIGAKIVAYAELLEIEGNKLSFKVEAYDGDTKIGDGTHVRAVINRGPSGG